MKGSNTPREGRLFPQPVKAALKRSQRVRSKDSVQQKKIEPKWNMLANRATLHPGHFSEHVFKLGCKNVYLSGLYENPICDTEGMSNRASDKNK